MLAPQGRESTSLRLVLAIDSFYLGERRKHETNKIIALSIEIPSEVSIPDEINDISEVANTWRLDLILQKWSRIFLAGNSSIRVPSEH